MKCLSTRKLSVRFSPTALFRRLLPAVVVTCGVNVVHASQAYGTINNFDTVNDTGSECHGFEIEIEGVHSTDITYTFDWNHYGKPKITDTGASTLIRYESAKNADGSWAAFTAIPATPIAPTQGHQFTNPSVNFGGEHFGLGYRGAPTAIKYNWLVDDGAGNLIHGGAVQVATPVFAYSPPVPPAPGVPAKPAKVVAVIAPPPPEVPDPLEFGKALWVKEIRTSTHNNEAVGLRDLVDPGAVGRKDWRNGEPDEVEVEWQILQTDYNAGVGGGANGELAGAPEDLPNNDEIITRRYEFYKYGGPIDTETGEAMAQTVAADGVHGVGTVLVLGVTYDLTKIAVVGNFLGAQMSALDLGAHVGLIDHLDDGEINVPYPARLMVIDGSAAPTVTTSGALPTGLNFDAVTGILSGTPSESGVFSFTVNAEDANTPKITKTYTLTIVAAGALLAPQSTIDTSALPAASGTTTGDGPYDNGTDITVTATPQAGYVFSNWTDNSVVVSNSASFTFTTDVNRSLIANFVPVPALNLSINDAAILEGNSGSKNLNFTVTLSQVSASPVTVDYATADGATLPATTGSDYTATSGPLTFAPGETSKTISVLILGDTIDEADETFFVNLSNANGAPITKAQGLGTITNDDAVPTLSINDVSVLEGNSGTTNVNFTVTLSQVLTQPVTVKYATANGSAVDPSDYNAQGGTLTILAGQTRGIITVSIVGDTLDELDETFFVNLSAAKGATISDTQGRCVIVDNDAAPSVTINDVSVTEGDSGTKNADFTISLSAASGQTVTVNAIPFNGTARTPADYVTGGARLIFAPGETVKTFSVPVNGDLLDEPTENFFVILSAPVSCSIGRGRGTGTILDNDAAPSITIDDVHIGEGNAGQRTVAFRLKLSKPSGQLVKVNYVTAGGTATAGVDYVAVPTSQIAFTSGNLYAYARVLINGDVLNEPDETFKVNLSGATNATIADNQAIGAILNDDSAPSLSINDVSIAEGNSGTKNLNFTVTLAKPSGRAVTVNYATADGVARFTSDYTAKSGTLTFAAGQTSKTVSISINGDTLVEGDETLFVLLSSPTNASIGRARGVGAILNDDVSG